MSLGHAAGNPSAYDLYESGAFTAALTAGENEGDAAGLIVAARAAIADAELRDAPCASCLNHLEDIARRVIAAEPEEAEGYIYLSVALGLRARLLGLMEARREKLAEHSDEALEIALQLSPASSLALAARGGWHIEVARLAGNFLGRILYGARADEGKTYFRRAVAAEPENLVIRYQFALSLSGYDLHGERPEVETLLAEAAAIMPRDAYEVAVQTRAAELATLLRDGDIHSYGARVNAFQGFP
jgi:hypothetical protein